MTRELRAPCPLGALMRVVQAPPDEPLLPVTVVGGDSGAGKSALIRHLLARPDGRSLAVILDDSASLGLNPTTVSYRDGPFCTLVNGCICCTRDGDFSDALA